MSPGRLIPEFFIEWGRRCRELPDVQFDLCGSLFACPLLHSFGQCLSYALMLHLLTHDQVFDMNKAARRHKRKRRSGSQITLNDANKRPLLFCDKEGSLLVGKNLRKHLLREGGVFTRLEKLRKSLDMDTH